MVAFLYTYKDTTCLCNNLGNPIIGRFDTQLPCCVLKFMFPLHSSSAQIINQPFGWWKEPSKCQYAPLDPNLDF